MYMSDNCPMTKLQDNSIIDESGGTLAPKPAQQIGLAHNGRNKSGREQAATAPSGKIPKIIKLVY
jgi:hypothetical protein